MMNSSIFSTITLSAQNLRTNSFWFTSSIQSSKYYLNLGQCFATSSIIMLDNFSKKSKTISFLLLNSSSFVSSLFKLFVLMISDTTHSSKLLITVLVDLSMLRISFYQFLPKFLRNYHPCPPIISLNLLAAH